jgi:predicted RNA-binding Zn ribbon-like protein
MIASRPANPISTSDLPRAQLEAARADLPAAIDAGWLCLDFSNTVDWHASDHPVELVPTYIHLLAWSRTRDLLTGAQAEHLVRQASTRSADALEVYQRAISLREAIYGYFSARGRDSADDSGHLTTINAEVQRAFDHLSIDAQDGGQAVWRWEDNPTALDRFLWPIARSAADLLTSPDSARVRECAGHPCGWLFLDTSRNRSRRWCSMESCGNRAKARRHYERVRSGRSAVGIQSGRI